MDRNRDDGVQVPMVWQGYSGNARIRKVTMVSRSRRPEYDPDPQGVGFGLISREGKPWPPRR